ncbi:di-trans,poly-cis-decaprenylcistransferase [bacterium]|nr:di-trans,poly-cis-decaprenylcistransferase [bacterium]
MNKLKHLAIIMDGNGRWAQKNSLPRTEGHRKGASVVREIVTHCREIGIEALTLYAFSEENWGRPKDEVSALMELLLEFMTKERITMLENNIHFNPIGTLEKLPDFLKKTLFDLEKETSVNAIMDLNIALSYSGRQDILNAIKKTISQINFDMSFIDEAMFSKNLSTHSCGGDVDLLIRTGGDFRISNFLLWESAYAELFFEKKLWPEFTSDDLDSIIQNFSQRDRRFGLVKNL